MVKKMRIRISVLLIIFILLAVSVSELYKTKEVKPHTSFEGFTAYLDERVPSLMEDYDIPGVNIAVVTKGKVAWSKAYGYADLEKGRKMTTDTYCRVESISKSVTAFGVMKLVQQGKIDLDKPVKQYITKWEFPNSQYAEENVTVRQLLCHTAGLPLGNIFERYSPTEEIPSLKENLSKEATLMQEPGVSFSYSNTGYNLLELLIEEVTNRDFAEYMKEEVLIPLGMNKSTFIWSDELEPKVPVGYDLKGNSIQPYVYPSKASGGLLASVDDIAAFAVGGMTNDLYTNNRILTPYYLNQIYTPMTNEIGVYGLVFDSYGLGHYIENLPTGKQAVSHGGQGGGYMTHFHSVPETGDAIVILTNSQRSWPFISYILTDWAKWSGFDFVGMGRIILGQKMLWTLSGLIWFMILWQTGRLGQGLIAGIRKYAPFSRQSRLFRLVQVGSAAILMAGLLWCRSQDYLLVSSVFPTVSSWLGSSGFIFAVILLLSALFPWKTLNQGNQRNHDLNS